MVVVVAKNDRTVRAVVIAANGPAFCAGHDLKELTARRSDKDGGRADVELLNGEDSVAPGQACVFYEEEGTRVLGGGSSINGQILEKDGNGYISRLTPEGKVVSARWVTGLNAPKGLRSVENTLWVSDIDEVVAIDGFEDLVGFLEHVGRFFSGGLDLLVVVLGLCDALLGDLAEAVAADADLGQASRQAEALHEAGYARHLDQIGRAHV